MNENRTIGDNERNIDSGNKNLSTNIVPSVIMNEKSTPVMWWWCAWCVRVRVGMGRGGRHRRWTKKHKKQPNVAWRLGTKCMDFELTKQTGCHSTDGRNWLNTERMWNNTSTKPRKLFDWWQEIQSNSTTDGANLNETSTPVIKTSIPTRTVGDNERQIDSGNKNLTTKPYHRWQWTKIRLR